MIDAFLRREIDVGSFPGAAYAIGTADGVEHEGAVGHAVAVPLRIGATTATIYDCASTTKVLVTTVLVLQAVSEGRISLDDEHRGFSYRELLSHTSGLKAWLPMYSYLPARFEPGRVTPPRQYIEAIERDGRECARGEKAIYSDLNFVLLCDAIREIFGDYAEAARTRIFEPLGLRDTGFNPPEKLKPRIAATEWAQRFEAGMCATRSVVFTGFRQGLMWGDANDGNSFHAGGTAGNAGLFATARDVFRILQAFVRGELVPPELAEESAREVKDGRGLGWQLAGPGLSSRSFGHMGFTGTSVWIDGGRIFVLLTNRVHPCAAPIAMTRIRAEFHRLASAS
jgi:CubicO group peptidase (beta-lactamase class C family)